MNNNYKTNPLLIATKDLESKTRELIIHYEEIDHNDGSHHLQKTIVDEPICCVDESFDVGVAIMVNKGGYNFPQFASRAHDLQMQITDDVWVEVFAGGEIDGQCYEITLGSMKIVAIAPEDPKSGFIIAKRI